MVPEEINKKIKININLGDVPEIKVDEEQLYQVLLNLVNNAVQSIEKKGASLSGRHVQRQRSG